MSTALWLNDCTLMLLLMVLLQGLQSAVNYTLYVAGRDLQAQPNYANPAKVLNVSTLSMVFSPSFKVCRGIVHCTL